MYNNIRKILLAIYIFRGVLGHYLDIILEKTGFFALFQSVLRTKTGHYSEQFSLPGNVLV